MKARYLYALAFLAVGCGGGLGAVDTDDSSPTGNKPGNSKPTTNGDGSDDDGPNESPTGEVPSTPGSATNEQPGGSGTSTSMPGQPTAPPVEKPQVLQCNGTPSMPAPLLRLTNTEVVNSIGALFPGVAVEAALLAPESSIEGFNTLSEVQSTTATGIEGFDGVARAVASAVVADPASYSKCMDAADSDAFRSCARKFALDTAAAAYRRPLEDAESTRVGELFDQASDQWGATKGLELALNGILEAPQFLYRAEYAGEAIDGVADLSGYEVASRLSYLLWDTAPDADLLSAAAAGDLGSADGVEIQARRMLADDKARAAVKTFHYQWLRLEKIQNLRRVSPVSPEFGLETSNLLLEATEKYVDTLFWEGATLRDVFTDTRAYVNDELAPIYGVDAPGSTELQLVDVNPEQRAGVLTQAGLMAGFAHETTDSPVLRGVFVMDRFLCSAPPPPPAGIPSSPNLEIAQEAKTTRSKLELGHALGACQACHEAIDGIGFTFGHYDQVGAWRDEENGEPIDATGELVHTLDIDGKIDGTVELGAKLAESEQVRSCIAQQWYRYGLGLSKASVDKCALDPVLNAFSDENVSLQELLVALVTSDAFRRRSVVSEVE